jgi:hypothetical protein
LALFRISLFPCVGVLCLLFCLSFSKWLLFVIFVVYFPFVYFLYLSLHPLRFRFARERERVQVKFETSFASLPLHLCAPYVPRLAPSGNLPSRVFLPPTASKKMKGSFRYTWERKKKSRPSTKRWRPDVKLFFFFGLCVISSPPLSLIFLLFQLLPLYHSVRICIPIVRKTLADASSNIIFDRLNMDDICYAKLFECAEMCVMQSLRIFPERDREEIKSSKWKFEKRKCTFSATSSSALSHRFPPFFLLSPVVIRKINWSMVDESMRQSLWLMRELATSLGTSRHSSMLYRVESYLTNVAVFCWFRWL